MTSVHQTKLDELKEELHATQNKSSEYSVLCVASKKESCLPEDERSEIELELECPVCLGNCFFRITEILVSFGYSLKKNISKLIILLYLKINFYPLLQSEMSFSCYFSASCLDNYYFFLNEVFLHLGSVRPSVRDS